MEQARAAARRGEVPVGAVILDPQGRCVAAYGNEVRARRDPTAHAELLALREACRTHRNERLVGYTLTTTLEPCAMCATAISFARLAAVFYAAPDPKGGGILHGPRVFTHPTCHHRPLVKQVPGAQESQDLLRTFFQARRHHTPSAMSRR